MQLLRLRLINFRQHEATELHFTAGLTGIVGANGAGKSTLLEAIGYALYGVAATRGTRDTLRRRGALPRARFEVELEFALGAHRYRVVRGLTMAELYLDGQVIANSTGAVTERVIAILGMSRDEFFNTYFTGQKELAVMASMGAAERARFLSRVLGYEKLREAQEAVRARRSALRAELTGLEQGLADPALLEADLAVATRALEEARAAREAAALAERNSSDRITVLQPEWTAAVQRRTAWQALDGERRVAEQQVAGARAAFEAIDREIAASLRAQTRLRELADPLAAWPGLVTEREALDRAAQEWTARSQQAARREEAQRRAAELREELAGLPAPDAMVALNAARAAALAARGTSEEQAEERRTRWTQDKQESETRLEQFRDRYRELKEQRDLVEERGPEGICPTCGRPLGKDFTTMLELLGRQLEEVEIDGKYLRQRNDQLKEAPADLHELEEARQQWERELRRLTEAQGQLQAQLRQREAVERELAMLTPLPSDATGGEAPVVAYDAMRHAEVRRALAALEPLRRESDQLSGVAARGESLAAEAAEAEKRATGSEEHLVALDRRLAALQWDAEAFARLEAELQRAQAERQAAQVTLAEAGAHAEGAARLRDGVLARQADRAERALTARRLGEEIALLQELDRAFSDLRDDLNLQMRPELSDRASQLLAQLTQGRYTDLDLDESYMAAIVEAGEIKPVLSGGEEDIVNLALRLAISQMIASRAGQPLSLLVLDEIFGSLDDDRRGSVLALLRALSDRFPQVILITHVEGMRDAFDRVIRMVYHVETGTTTAHDEAPEVADAAA